MLPLSKTTSPSNISPVPSRGALYTATAGSVSALLSDKASPIIRCLIFLRSRAVRQSRVRIRTRPGCGLDCDPPHWRSGCALRRKSHMVTYTWASCLLYGVEDTCIHTCWNKLCTCISVLSLIGVKLMRPSLQGGLLNETRELRTNGGETATYNGPKGSVHRGYI